jgi:hypothetical protein
MFIETRLPPSASLIHTRLQPGDPGVFGEGNRLNGFLFLFWAENTWLNPGANEINDCRFPPRSFAFCFTCKSC